ncbi:MAG: tRNA uridine(34) 5-carboxymethylaminomethyl modification radical SAM/GNAT enzyme Elp3 [Candidatus Bathyarchaeia archaeon]|nr:tRNA uridine(34) 5-carboxymethylaminomethyl modification radical SAM/GNAT enzyme Elp3 [Candidatus Bathyarchaeota archaeon]
MNSAIHREIIEYLMNMPNPTPKDVQVAKIRVAEKYRLSTLPPNSEIIKYLRPEEKFKLLKVLRRKAVRTISGVTIIAVMAKPWPCPQKEPCAYCPGGPYYGVPQSYTGREPATMRGLQFNFDPYKQVRHRIEQLRAIGHAVDKVELIVMGGTFPAMPEDYQRLFIKECLDAITGVRSTSLEEAKRNAEVGEIRNVGITIETRPDWCKEQHVDLMLSYGATRVEIGVQNIYDDIYALVNRGHTVKDVIEATRILKDSGLKVVYHMMPGLPGSDFERDLEAFKRIFSDSDFKPDMLKIYPCLVVKGTKVYDWWVKGLYKPYTTEEAAKLIAEVKKIVPEWVRIMRVQRDIPAYLIEAGVKSSNLREIALKMLRDMGLRCRCIRCREVGHRWLKDHIKPNMDNVKILVRRYEASKGEEFFISAEDTVNDVLIGYLRLRIPSDMAHRPEISGKNASIIRELRVLGPLVPVGRREGEGYQHKGFGRVLLEEAERISLEQGCKKILVTSALGTKRYYMRLGYTYDGPYMSKNLYGGNNL